MLHKDQDTPVLIDHDEELATLNDQLNGSSSRRRPAFVVMYGRRRVGKSTLLKVWAKRSGLPNTYWLSDRDLPVLHGRQVYARFKDIAFESAPLFPLWGALWDAVAATIGDRKHIIIIDELPYAAASDPAMLSAVQYAWDEHFLHRQVILVICGSHVHRMEELLQKESPLYGRTTRTVELGPLPFPQMKAFFLKWSAEERVAGYAIVGGIPEYYEWLESNLSLIENLRTRVVDRRSQFLAEARFPLYDQMQQPALHLSVIKAIGTGQHTFEELRHASECPDSDKLDTRLTEP